MGSSDFAFIEAHAGAETAVEFPHTRRLASSDVSPAVFAARSSKRGGLVTGWMPASGSRPVCPATRLS